MGNFCENFIINTQGVRYQLLSWHGRRRRRFCLIPRSSSFFLSGGWRKELLGDNAMQFETFILERTGNFEVRFIIKRDSHQAQSLPGVSCSVSRLSLCDLLIVLIQSRGSGTTSRQLASSQSLPVYHHRVHLQRSSTSSNWQSQLEENGFLVIIPTSTRSPWVHY